MFGKSLAIALIALAPVCAQQTDVPTLGASVLQHADIARQALANHDTKAAQDHIAQALAATDRIKAASPGAEEPLRVRLASALDAVSTIVPAKRRGSADRLKSNSSVSEVNGTYTATTLNVSSARNHLLAAQSALKAGDNEAAANDIAAVQSDVTTTTMSGDLPLVQAKNDLAIALARVRDGKYKDAILPLNSASRALDRFVHQEPRPHHADMAAKMSLEMNAYAERIEKDHADAADRLAGWLEHVNGWFSSGMAQ
jgi:YfdX protein